VKVLAIMHGLIGDTLMRLPALRALREARPEVEILAVVDPLSAPVVAVNPLVDRVIVWDRRNRGLAYQWARLREIRAFGPEVALDFYFGSRTPWIAWLSGASRRIGPARTSMARRLFTDPLPYPLPADQHMLDRFHALVAPLGAAELRRVWEFPVHPRLRVRMLERVGPVSANDVIYVAGAGDPSKRLSMDRARGLLEGLVSLTPGKVLLVEDQREPELGKELLSVDGVHALPALPLPELGALFAEVGLVAVGDTGPLHVALGTARRVLTWYQSTDPVVHAAERAGVRWHYREVCPWQPCDARLTDRCQLECTASVEVDELVASARELLAGPDWMAPGLSARDPATVG
jgi:ADP-heptose:LPS heptosyltransferase